MTKSRGLFGYLKESVNYSKASVICFVCEIISAVVPFGNALAFAELINCIANGYGWGHVILVAIAYALIQLVMVITRRVENIGNMRMKQEYDLFQKKKICNSLKEVECDLFEDDAWVTGKLDRVNRLTGSLYDEITSLLRLISTILSVVLYIYYLSTISLPLVPLGIIAFVPSIIKSIVYSHIQLRQNKELGKLNFKHSRVYNMFFEIPFAQEVRVFGAFEYIRNRWKDALENVYSQKVKMVKTEALVDIFCLIFSMCVNGFIIYLICVAGSDAGQVAAAIPYSISVVGLVSSIDMTFKSIYYSLQELKEFDGFVAEYERDSQKPVNQKANNYVEVNKLTYTYPNGNTVLKDISFKLNEGETIALIGKNGSGKSTLLKIIAGIYDKYVGDVLVFGSRPSLISKDEIGMVFQFPAKYPFNATSNVWLQEDDGSIQDSFLQVNVSNREAILVQGFSNSVNLSGGEWQKIALSRLFNKKKNASLFLFDEPTAALDAKSEVEVFRYFQEYTKGKTCIYATHRLGIAKSADRILVVDGGSVVEQGSHKELLEKNGLYAELYKSQSDWYINEVNNESVI